MRKKEKAALVVERLRAIYPDSCSLVAVKDYELLFATRLSAQCTDARVNQVTEVLFSKYPTLEALAAADLDDICEIVRPCGLYKTKGKDIKEGAMMLLSRFGGRVPDTMDELLSLPGIGRKTANLILSDIYGQPAIVADTHCIRIAGRLGLTKETDPYKVEMDLKKIVEPQEQASLCHRFVHFGRDICRARSPRCTECPLSDLCAVTK
ncbi:MAG TPA: endonuclease III [Candidatus Ventrousia excrementavium]|uniref:Endonuclease III n=1 Tax=Candidatus Ventrousia excrementavium TaxID=2840961 RepID=A0A9D1IVR0_9CLOT|nr:endonuclease III [Candidatus Ventrousia excrementavium]